MLHVRFPLLAGALFAMCVSSALAAPNDTVRVGALPAPDTATAATSPDGDYRIGPLDVLDVAVLHVPEMTTTVRVSGSGQISLPLVGDIPANGRTAMELQRDIGHRLENMVQTPQVTIFIKEYASQRVTVEGEVNQPGIYPIEGKTTLLQAVALAHGTSQVAKLNDVTVFRTVDGRRLSAVFNLKDIRGGKLSDPEVFGNDVIEVNASGSKSVFRNIITAVPLATLFRPF
jgi:polysaccharide export outer membrane protein